MSRFASKSWFVVLLFAFGVAVVFAQTQQAQRTVPPAPDRKPGEGEGPFERLGIRGATMIDGAGAPPMGPVDIVIENNRIKEIKSVGFPKVSIRDAKRPAKGVTELDGSGMYVMTGRGDARPG